MATVFSLLVGLSLALAGCGPDDDPPITTNNVDRDMADEGADAGPDSADGGSGVDVATPDVGALPDAEPDVGFDPCADVACDPGYVCEIGVCELTDTCAAAIDLGTLAPGQTETVAGSLATDGADSVAATCGEAGGRERVIRFTLATSSLVEFQATWMGQFDGLVELRADCMDDATAVVCSDIEAGSQLLEAGTHHVILESRVGNPGPFEFRITAHEALCMPGSRMCNGAMLEVCSMEGTVSSHQCGDTCAGEACQGDTCSNAIVVSASGTYVGDAGGYASELNFAQNAACQAGDGMPIPTPGYDVVFYVPGLQAGDILTIDALTNDSNINAIFISQQCSDTAVCAATYKVENPDWVVTADGDYYVVIDKRQPSATPFQYSVGVIP